VNYRIEHDTMGDVRVPENALYGAQTQRAAENFPISGRRFPRVFIRALGLIKSAAASVNGTLGELPVELAQSIARAADEVSLGRHDEHFVVDIFQTGSGTSTNMNANEVIARLAAAHPNDHVNRGQSSNDVIPAAIHMAAAFLVSEELFPAMDALHQTLVEKSIEFHNIIKVGRTHLQDAVPMRLGHEFSGYARQIEMARERIRAALDGIYELPLGGTAIGTGLNAPSGFGRAVTGELTRRTGLPFREAANHFEAQSARDAVCFLSAALRNYAVALTKIANDIRWLGSGPRCGIGELMIPATQPGSSIMPGKVNPVIAESVLMACAEVIGHDATITWCCASGNLELNTMMPIMAYDLLDSISLLAAVSRNFETRCIRDVEADAERIRALVDHSLVMTTGLAREIGYEKASAIAREALTTGRSLLAIARERGGIPEQRLAVLLDAEQQAGS